MKNWPVKQIISALEKFTLCCLFTLATIGSASGAPVSVFAAASAAEIMQKLAADFSSDTGIEMRVVVAGSSTLAQQIVAGAPADLFVSANPEWVAFVKDKAGFSSGAVLFSNRLVVIAPKGSTVELTDLAAIASNLGDGRLALGDPAHVPAGIYARQALQGAGVWAEVENRVAPASNVRAALRLVSAGAASLGIVYVTDISGTDVEILLEIDPALHETIAYVATIAPEADMDAVRFFDFLQTDAAKSVALEFGYPGAGGE